MVRILVTTTCLEENAEEIFSLMNTTGEHIGVKIANEFVDPQVDDYEETSDGIGAVLVPYEHYCIFTDTLDLAIKDGLVALDNEEE